MLKGFWTQAITYRSVSSQAASTIEGRLKVSESPSLIVKVVPAWSGTMSRRDQWKSVSPLSPGGTA